MKIRTHFDRETPPVSLRRAWLISRAWRPTRLSPISPSISALGTRAATESITMMSTALDSTSISAICKRLLGAARLADQQRLDVDAQPLAPRRVERVLGVDERRDAAVPLGVGHRVQGDRRLAARLGAEQLDDPAPRQPLAAQRQVERQGPRRDPLDLQVAPLAQLHDRPGAERLLDLADRVVQRLRLGRRRRRLHLGRSLSLGHDARSFMGILDSVRKNTIVSAFSSVESRRSTAFLRRRAERGQAGRRRALRG